MMCKHRNDIIEFHTALKNGGLLSILKEQTLVIRHRQLTYDVTGDLAFYQNMPLQNTEKAAMF